jgi:hypothetical protein
VNGHDLVYYNPEIPCRLERGSYLRCHPTIHGSLLVLPAVLALAVMFGTPNSFPITGLLLGLLLMLFILVVFSQIMKPFSMPSFRIRIIQLCLVLQINPLIHPTEIPNDLLLFD